jgi:hypothetical protein
MFLACTLERKKWVFEQRRGVRLTGHMYDYVYSLSLSQKDPETARDSMVDDMFSCR